MFAPSDLHFVGWFMFSEKCQGFVAQLLKNKSNNIMTNYAKNYRCNSLVYSWTLISNQKCAVSTVGAENLTEMTSENLSKVICKHLEWSLLMYLCDMTAAQKAIVTVVNL